MCRMKLTTKIQKYGELKEHIEELNEELAKLSAEITKELEETDQKNAESDDFKVTFIDKTTIKYTDACIETLKRKNAFKCIKETVDQKIIKSSIESGIISEADVSAFKHVTNSKYITCSRK